MTVTGQIYDNQTNAGLPGASVTLVSSQGNPIGGGVSADSNGIFSISSPALDSGGQLLISNIGYKSVIADPGTVVSTGLIGLDEQTASLDAATVTATIKKKNYTPLLIGGAGLLLLAATSKKKRKARIGAINVNWSDVAIKGGIAVGAYLLVVKPILTKLGVFQSAAEKATTDAQAKALADAKTQATATGQSGAQYSADQYTGWANDIFTTGINNWTKDPDQMMKIVNDVINVDTMVDLQQLITAFGTRTTKLGVDPFSWCYTTGFGCPSVDLPTFLKLALDETHINYINGYLNDQKINYQF